MNRRDKGIEKKFASFEREFDRTSKAALQKTSKKFGRSMVRQRLRQLAGQTVRRKDGVLYKVTKNGYLVLLDMAPMSVPHEYGRIIKAERGLLRVPIGREGRGWQPAHESFTVKMKDGTILLMDKATKEPLATLRKKVVIKRNQKSGRFTTIVDNNLKDYVKELEEDLAAGFLA